MLLMRNVSPWIVTPGAKNHGQGDLPVAHRWLEPRTGI
jgi:hypothetical protein